MHFKVGAVVKFVESDAHGPVNALVTDIFQSGETPMVSLVIVEEQGETGTRGNSAQKTSIYHKSTAPDGAPYYYLEGLGL